MNVPGMWMEGDEIVWHCIAEEAFVPFIMNSLQFYIILCPQSTLCHTKIKATRAIPVSPVRKTKTSSNAQGLAEIRIGQSEI